MYCCLLEWERLWWVFLCLSHHFEFVKDRGWGQITISLVYRRKKRGKACKEPFLRNYTPTTSSACGPDLCDKILDFKLMPNGMKCGGRGEEDEHILHVGGMWVFMFTLYFLKMAQFLTLHRLLSYYDLNTLSIKRCETVPSPWILAGLWLWWNWNCDSWGWVMKGWEFCIWGPTMMKPKQPMERPLWREPEALGWAPSQQPAPTCQPYKWSHLKSESYSPKLSHPGWNKME